MFWIFWYFLMCNCLRYPFVISRYRNIHALKIKLKKIEKKKCNIWFKTHQVVLFWLHHQSWRFRWGTHDCVPKVLSLKAFGDFPWCFRTSKHTSGPPESPINASTFSSYAHKCTFSSNSFKCSDFAYFSAQSSKSCKETFPLCNWFAKWNTLSLEGSVSPQPLTSHTSPVWNLSLSGVRHAYWTVEPRTAHSPSLI